uniref:Putative reverse transcriptase domain-containing protein n=1 Tax=Tanacetum cinerariifolium TaxID=118510 RepID=A0A6L2JPC9_TANCI|nr:putative reverse transcriptase domain-containing protein [Tanacetum cinerariifolium]
MPIFEQLDIEVKFDMTVRQQVVFECLGASHAQDFLLDIPIDGLDSFGEHAVHYKELPSFKYQHDMVRDVLFDVCRHAGISAKKEAHVIVLTDPLDGRSKLRPADVLIFGWVGGKHVCVYPTGVSPLVGRGAGDVQGLEEPWMAGFIVCEI